MAFKILIPGSIPLVEASLKLLSYSAKLNSCISFHALKIYLQDELLVYETRSHMKLGLVSMEGTALA